MSWRILSNPIIRNIISLSSAELVSKSISLITISYIARTITAESFGILSFATAFTSYFLLFVVFGLDTYGIRETAFSKNQEDYESNISSLVNNILSLRMILAVTSFLMLAIVTSLIDKPLQVKIILLINGLGLFSTALLLNWYYQGIEKMHIVAVRQILLAVLTLAGTILFVHTSNDIITAAAIPVLASLLNSIFLLFHYTRKFSAVRFIPDLRIYKNLLKLSFPLALSSFMIAIYYHLDMVLLGYLKTQYEVGIYSAAYRIFLTGIIPFQLILSSVFPQISRIGLADSQEFRKTIRLYAVLMIGTGIVSCITMLIFREQLILLLFGKEYLHATIPLTILAMNALVISINMFFGNPLIAWGKQRQYSLAISIGAIVNIVLNIYLIPKYSYIGASFATLLSEVSVFIGVFFLFNVNVKGKL